MPFTFSDRSRAHLQGVHPDLIRVAERALAISSQDFAVLEGVRTQARQDALWAQGRTAPGRIVTWVHTSNHRAMPDGYGHAIDVGAWVNGAVDFTAARYVAIGRAFMEASHQLGVHIRWGADWDEDGRLMERGESDLGHFEIRAGVPS